jgi:hypothetical protein
MATLTPDQKIKLSRAGIAPSTIAAYQLGTISSAGREKVNTVLNGGFKLGPANPPKPSVAAPSRTPINIGDLGTAGRLLDRANQPPTPKVSLRDKLAGPVPFGGVPAKRTPAPPPVYGRNGNTSPNGIYQPTAAQTIPLKPTAQTGPTGPTGGLGDVLPKGRGPSSISNQILDLPASPTLGEPPPFPGAPAYPDINLPEFVDRSAEMEAKARAAYAAAYAPLYQSLEMGKTNATQNQQRSDQVIAGLYAGLANDFNTSGQQQAQQYQQKGQESQASGANQQNFYNQGAANAQNYNSQMAGAANTEGASRRSDLVQQLNNVLSQFDQQKLGYQSQEAVGAIQQGNVLTQRDADQQQQRINNILQTTGIQDSRTAAAASAAIQAWEAQYGAQKDQYGAQRDAFNDQVAQRDAQLAALTAAQKDAYQKSEDERKNRQTETGLIIDANKAGGTIDPTTGQVSFPGTTDEPVTPLPGTPEFDDQPAATKITIMGDQLDPGRGNEYLDFFYEFMRTHDPINFNAQNFSDQVAEEAGKRGLNRRVASQLAPEFWVNIQTAGRKQ